VAHVDGGYRHGCRTHPLTFCDPSDPLYSASDDAPKPAAPHNLRAAFFPLAFPGVATPYGIATVILLIALAPDAKWAIIGLMLCVLLVDFAIMLISHVILRIIGLPLMLVSTVFGVLQVALSIQVIFFSVRLIIEHGV
jgi:multiple antibiotic resistance protein